MIQTSRKPNTCLWGLVLCAFFIFSGCESKPLPVSYYDSNSGTEEKSPQKTSRDALAVAKKSDAAQAHSGVQWRSSNNVNLDRPLFTTEFELGPLCETCLGIVPNSPSEAKIIHDPNQDDDPELRPADLTVLIESLQARLNPPSKPAGTNPRNFFGEDDLD